LKSKADHILLFTPDSRFTDDTVLTVAVADCILHHRDYAKPFKEYGRRYPDAGYGGMFRDWLDQFSGEAPEVEKFPLGVVH
jgi:ADP-ribosylglycohydrolase